MDTNLTRFGLTLPEPTTDEIKESNGRIESSPLMTASVQDEAWRQWLKQAEEVFFIIEEPIEITIGSKDYKTWLTIEINDVTGYRDMDYNYMGQLMMIAPYAMPKARREMLIAEGGNVEQPKSKLDLVYSLASAGGGAIVTSTTGDTADQVFLYLLDWTYIAWALPGSMLDRPQNGLGLSGWSAIRGDFMSTMEKEIRRKHKAQSRKNKRLADLKERGPQK